MRAVCISVSIRMIGNCDGFPVVAAGFIEESDKSGTVDGSEHEMASTAQQTAPKDRLQTVRRSTIRTYNARWGEGKEGSSNNYARPQLLMEGGPRSLRFRSRM
jgi:hypothetical protein